MSMITYPLNNIEYTAEDAELFHSTRTSGIYATNSFDYSVTGADNTIVIGTGIAWIKNTEFSGKVVAQKEPISLDMGLPDSIYPRIDSVVIQFNANRNATEILVKNGIASSSPVAPDVVKNESIYELHLYHVRRNAGELSISSNSITDLRPNDDYCGLMYDSVTQAVDSTLSKAGVAADAATVGSALSGKAPAGYGYGGSAIGLGNIASEEELDAALATIYDTMGSTETKLVTYVGHPASGWRWFGILSKSSANNGSFVAHSAVYGGCKVIKTKNGGTWQPIEWENPPMLPNEEYRTIERWNNKPVYRKLIQHTNREAYSGEAIWDIPHNISHLDNSYGVEIKCRTQGYQIPYIGTSESTSVSGCTTTNIELKTLGSSNWATGRTWYFDMKYVKTA